LTIFVIPRTSHKTGDRLSAAAPRAWNRLPTELKQMHCTSTFRHNLKHFCFSHHTVCTTANFVMHQQS